MKKFCLMLDGTRFAFCKVDHFGERTGYLLDWSIRANANSMWPREIFFLIQRTLRSAAKQKGPPWDAMSKALQTLGEEFDCEARVSQNPATNVIWLKQSTSLASFVLSDLSEVQQITALLNFRIDRSGFIHPRRTGVAREKVLPPLP